MPNSSSTLQKSFELAKVKLQIHVTFGSLGAIKIKNTS